MENQTKPKPPSSAATQAAPTTPTTANGENLLGTTNSELTSICLSLLAAFVLARLLAVVSAVATALAAPLTGFYLMSTCPTVESFDAKRELKRVLRGDNLPEDHPDKPKGFLGKALAKVTATIEAEAAAFAGCSVEIIDIIGLVKIAVIRNTAAKTDYYWLGAVNRWRYIMARNVPNDTHQRMKRD